MLTLEDLAAKTLEYGGKWAWNHVQRVLVLIGRLAEGTDYDQEAIQYAAYLHDWGGYPHFRQEGVNHALRSREVAEEVLRETILSPGSIHVALEAIASHDYRVSAPGGPIEAILLREADFLDFLGAIGIARAFSAAPKDLARGLEIVTTRRDSIVGQFTLPRARELAERRFDELHRFVASLEEESLGYL